jgi:hypothetical protein
MKFKKVMTSFAILTMLGVSVQPVGTILSNPHQYIVYAETTDDVSLVRSNPDKPLVDSQNDTLPKYTVEIDLKNAKLARPITKEDISFDDAFTNAQITSVTGEENGTHVQVKFSKAVNKMQGASRDGNLKITKSALVKTNGGTIYSSPELFLHDDFIPKVVYATNGSSTVQPTGNNIVAQNGVAVGQSVFRDLWRNIADFAKEIEGFPALKCCVFADSIFSIGRLIFSAFAGSQPDPYMAELQVIEGQLNAVQNQMTNGMRLVSDEFKRQEYDTMRTKLADAKNKVYEPTNIKHLDNAVKAMKDIVDGHPTQGEQAIDDEWMKQLYHTQVCNENGKIVEDGNYGFLDMYQPLALLMTGEYLADNREDAFKINDGFQSFEFNFNSETFNKREEYNGYYKEWFKYVMVPIVFAIQYDLNKNMKIKEGLVANQSYLTNLLNQPLDEQDKANINNALNGFISGTLRVVNNNIQTDKCFLGMKNYANSNAPTDHEYDDEVKSSYINQTLNVIGNSQLVSKAYDKATNGLKAEKKDFDEDKIVAYRLDNRQINRVMGKDSLGKFAQRAILPNPSADGPDFAKRMSLEDIRKIVQASSTYFREDNRTHMNIFEELIRGGFKMGLVTIEQFQDGSHTLLLNDTSYKTLQDYMWGIHRNKTEWSTRFLDRNGISEKYEVVMHKESSLYSRSIDESKTKANNTVGYYFLNLK